MNVEMYRLFFDIQKKHWWFATKKSIVMDAIKRRINLDKSQAVLDIGCGSGLMLNDLGLLAKVSGMDVSKDAIQFSKEIFNGEIKQGALPDKIPFKAESFDVITALDVIEHIVDDVESLKSIRNLLKDNGMAIITVPAYMFLWSPFDDINEHKRRYTLSELRDKLCLSGFYIEKLSYFNTLLFPVVFLIRKLKKITGDDAYSDIKMPIKQINYLLQKIFGVEKFLLRRCNLPFGVSILAIVRKHNINS